MQDPKWQYIKKYQQQSTAAKLMTWLDIFHKVNPNKFHKENPNEGTAIEVAQSAVDAEFLEAVGIKSGINEGLYLGYVVRIVSDFAIVTIEERIEKEKKLHGQNTVS